MEPAPKHILNAPPTKGANHAKPGTAATRPRHTECHRRRTRRSGDDRLADIAPDLGQYIIGFAFGEIYNRPALDLRQRELITLAALAAQGGCENQLRVHIHAARNVGLSREEIIEAFIHCVPYLGFPKVLNAVFVAKAVFADNSA